MEVITLRLAETGDHVFSMMMDHIPPVGTVFLNDAGGFFEQWEAVRITILAKPVYLHEVQGVEGSMSQDQKTTGAAIAVKRLADLPKKAKPSS